MKRALIVGPAWVGDMVLCEPLLRALRLQHPGIELHVAAPKASLGIAARMADAVCLHELPFVHGAFDLRARLATARALRRLQFERAYVLPMSWKSALAPMLAGIPERIGYVGEARYGLLTEARRLRRADLPLMVQRFGALARPAGAAFVEVPVPRLAADRANAAALRARFALLDDMPVLALCPGAEFGPAKRWPAEHFAALAARFSARGYRIWLFGARADAVLADAVVAALGRGHASSIVNLVGRTSLVDAVDLLAEADIVASNDSGLMHVAAAVGIAVVGIFGSSSPAFTPALGVAARSLQRQLACQPCFARTCRFGHYDCLRGLAPELVGETLDALRVDRERVEAAARA